MLIQFYDTDKTLTTININQISRIISYGKEYRIYIIGDEDEERIKISSKTFSIISFALEKKGLLLDLLEVSLDDIAEWK